MAFSLDSVGTGSLWRVFPWDPGAAAGSPFSPTFLPSGQGAGRFDLPGGRVLYLAETPEHAVAEKIQRYRGQEIDDADLQEFGRTLALVDVRFLADREGVSDLCDPAVLTRHRIRPDEVAARTKTVTQRIAAGLNEAGCTGLRWWSAFWGEWHSVVLFVDRLSRGTLAYGEPEALRLDHPAVIDAAEALGIRRAEF